MLSTEAIRWWVLAGITGLVSLHPIMAAAEDDVFELPPPPESLPPHRAGEFQLAMVFPVQREPLCPEGRDCVFGGGGGIAATLEWRWPRGVALGVGYDVWLLDGNSVYEITSLQYLRGRFRYYGFRRSLVHPFIGASVGALLFGDVFQKNAFGAGVEGAVGIELEITATLSFTAALAARFFSTGPFNSETDGVRRSDGFGVNSALALQFGLVLLEAP